MKRIQTDSGPIDMRYDQDIQRIEMNTDGSHTLMQPHQVLNLIEVLKRLVELHDELGLGEQSGLIDCARFCKHDGTLETGAEAVLILRPDASPFKRHTAAIEHGREHGFGYYRLVYTKQRAINTIFACNPNEQQRRDQSEL